MAGCILHTQYVPYIYIYRLGTPCACSPTSCEKTATGTTVEPTGKLPWKTRSGTNGKGRVGWGWGEVENGDGVQIFVPLADLLPTCQRYNGADPDGFFYILIQRGYYYILWDDIIIYCVQWMQPTSIVQDR